MIIACFFLFLLLIYSLTYYYKMSLTKIFTHSFGDENKATVHYHADVDGKSYLFVENIGQQTLQIKFKFGPEGDYVLNPGVFIGNQVYDWEKEKSVSYTLRQGSDYRTYGYNWSTGGYSCM